MDPSSGENFLGTCTLAEIVLLAGVVLVMMGLLRQSTDIGRPIPDVLLEMDARYKIRTRLVVYCQHLIAVVDF